MPFTFAIAVLAAIGLQQAPCTPGSVTDVNHGKDYTITVCSLGVVGLRGVEPPLRTAVSLESLDPGRPGRQLGGEILGGKDIGPDALAFLSALLVGKRVTLTYDGFRIGDDGARKYAYVYLPDKRFVNAELVSRGFGYAERQGAHPLRDQFLALEAKARLAKVGVWS